ncbi:MAG: InlB B-repeat-containing protein [Bacteroidaceae bacterium]
MRYKPSIAFDRMSGSAKGVTASQNKGAIFIRTRGTGSKKRTADQAAIKSIFKQLQQNWKNLGAAEIQAWNNAAKSQSGRRVLGQKAQLTGANLYLRLNFWVVRCGGQPIGLPPVLTGIEQPAVAEAAISNGSFMFRLGRVPEGADGLRLVIMATGPQTVGTVTGVGRGSTFCEPLVPSVGAVNLLQAYAAKFGMPNAGKPKVFLRYFYVNPTTGEKSGEQLINAFYSATEPVKYRLDMSNPDPTMGTVNRNGVEEFNEGSTVSIIATPTQNYTFQRWSDGNTLNPRNLVMDRDYQLQPVFVYDQHYRLTANVSPTYRGQVNGRGMYRPGETAHLVAEPSNGWEFDHWEDQPDNHNPERDVVMNSDVNLTAVFVAIRNSYDLYWNVNVYGFGDIESEEDCGTFDRGDEVVLTAVPHDQNYEFVRWSDGNTANPRTLVANRDYDIIAEFRHKTETRQIVVDTYYGETTGSGTYHLGDLVEISATPAEGFHFVKWDDDEDEHSLTRRFYLDRYSTRFYEAIMESDATYHIRAVCEPEEAGTVTGCVEAAHYEDSVELDVTPAAGWKIVGWSDDPHFDGDHRDIDVYEDLDLVVYMEEIEGDEE